MGQGTKSICIVTPFYKEAITRDEEISLKHLRHFLGRYDRCLVAPEGLKLDYPDFSIKRFDAGFFEDIPSYTRLLLSREFYEAFAGYKHILIYQFDCLAFSDELMRWCEMGYDYMGGPWLRSKKEPQRGFSRVGNGGLSLRRVESFLKVIDSQRYIKEHVSYLKDLCTAQLPDLGHLGLGSRIIKKSRVLREARRGAKGYISHYTLNEDHFWSDRARLFYPELKIAPVDIALGFSFDMAPQYCFEQNNQQLPFGCHGWYRYDKEFWKPYLLK